MSLLVFGIRSYAPLAEGIRLAGGFEAGDRVVRLFPDGERYQRSAVVTTDSHPRAVALADGFLTLVSVAPLLAEALVSAC